MKDGKEVLSKTCVKVTLRTTIRRFDLCRYANQKDVVFADLNNENPTYDAYEQDIAVAYFFFDSATAFQFEKGVFFSKPHGTFMIEALKSLFRIEWDYWIIFHKLEDCLDCSLDSASYRQLRSYTGSRFVLHETNCQRNPTIELKKIQLILPNQSRHSKSQYLKISKQLKMCTTNSSLKRTNSFAKVLSTSSLRASINHI